MEERIKESDVKKGSALPGILRLFCFAAFGMTIFNNPLEPFNIYYIAFGIITCLFFGWLFRKFLKGLLALFNPNLKKEAGKKVIGYAVDKGMLFMIPFAVLSLISAFYLKWPMTARFVSAAIMAAGTAAAFEISKLKDKKGIIDTIITSGVSYAFSFLLTFSVQYAAKAPGIIEGLAAMLPELLTKGGGNL